MTRICYFGHIIEFTYINWSIYSITMQYIFCRHYQGHPQKGSKACGLVKGTEKNHSRDCSREELLLYYMWANTYIVEVYKLWLVSMLPQIWQWALIPPESLFRRSSFKETWRGQIHQQDSYSSYCRMQCSDFWEYSGACCAMILTCKCSVPSKLATRSCLYFFPTIFCFTSVLVLFCFTCLPKKFSWSTKTYIMKFDHIFPLLNYPPFFPVTVVSFDSFASAFIMFIAFLNLN